MKTHLRRYVPGLAVVLPLFVIFFMTTIPNGKALTVEPGPTAVKDVRLFDGEKLLPRATVIFDKGKITAVGAHIKIPPRAEVIDGSGKTLLPGLIDSHVHVFGPAYLRQFSVFGVTTVIDMFMDVNMMKSLKADQAAGRSKDLAFLVSAGTLATAPGGHGTEYGLTIPTISRPDDAQSFVDARIAEGSDFIKIILDDGSSYNLPRPTLDIATISAIIKAAHARGKLAVIHAATLKNCEDSLNAGVDGLAHLFFNDASDPEFGRLAAQKRAFVIPTLSVLQGFGDRTEAGILLEDKALAPYLKPFDLRNLKLDMGFKTAPGSYRAAEAAIVKLKVAGVRILAGTDAPNPGTTYGASLHGELELLVKAGLTPIEALKAATSVPVATFEIAGRGRIQPGYAADLVLVSGDPTITIAATRDIAAVWKDGRRVNREQYREDAAKERAGTSAERAPKTEIPESGLISDFDGEKVSASFGAGWIISTDTIAGGNSKAEFRLVEDGAAGSGASLLITGEVIPGGANLWAGAFFSPGPVMMAPTDLSSRKAISFWSKGEGKAFAVMVFAQSHGFIPVSRTLKLGPDWREYVFPFTDFNTNGDDIMGIFIGASQEPGPFTLQIDMVRLR